MTKDIEFLKEMRTLAVKAYEDRDVPSQEMLLQMIDDWLKELAASRDSRILSAVPSDSQIDVIFSEYCNLYESEDGNYSALESDDFALAVKELFKRGIAG